MKKKYKIILYVSLGILLFTLSVFILRPRGYVENYKVGEYEIEEKYDVDSGYYSFKTTVDDIQFVDIFISNKVGGKKLISKVEKYSAEKFTCTRFTSEKFDLTPICRKDDEFVDAQLTLSKTEMNENFERKNVKIDPVKYDRIEVGTFLDRKLLVWAQTGYHYLTDGKHIEIEFLEEESYYNNLAYQMGEFVLTPNYDSEYVFDEFKVINMKNGKLKTWKLDEKVSFNSYFLGDKDGAIYLFDRKEKKEYLLNPKKEKLELISKNGEANVWSGKWETISTGRLANDDYHFESDDVFKYDIEDSGLYKVSKNLDFRIKVSDKKVSEIIKVDGNSVFYLVGDTLYSYDPEYGEVEMLSYSEWNFNNKNSIFIY
ncbi:MAG TPA: hypothetical protein DCY94_05110 [Firmicutes bacterium]|nr:hypothetical protein [Bacillota bacterium]